MPIVFAASAGKHRVSRRSAWFVVMTSAGTPFTTNQGEAGMWYEGKDEEGVWLEIGTVQQGSNEKVIHAMPMEHRHSGREGK